LRAAAAPRRSSTAGAPGRPNGPGARNWTTGSRVPLHRPWLRPR
jgi:hypothetical protein